jgi:hypothetical protein
MSAVPALWRLRQEDCEFNASLGYREFLASLGWIRESCFKPKEHKTKTE